MKNAHQMVKVNKTHEITKNKTALFVRTYSNNALLFSPCFPFPHGTQNATDSATMDQEKAAII